MTQKDNKPRQVLGSFSSVRFVPFAAVVLLGLILRALNLGAQPLWFDEGYSVFFATRDLAVMITRTAIDIHPPLYYVLLQVWMQLFGTSDVVMRILSVILGIAGLPVLYALARQLTDAKTAFIALLLFTISPFHIYYSQEVRMYGMVTLLCLVSVYLFVRLLKMPVGSARTAIVALLYVLVTVAALYTQYYAAFVLAFQVMYVFLSALQSSGTNAGQVFGVLRHWLAAWALVLLAYLPWLLFAGPKLYEYVTSKVRIEASTTLDPFTFLAQHLIAFSVGHVLNSGWIALAAIPFLGLVILGLSVLRRQRMVVPGSSEHSDPLQLSVLLLLVPLCLGFLVNLVFPFHPTHYERLLLISAPAFYLLAAEGIRRLWDLRAAFGLISLAVLISAAGISLYDMYTVQRYPDDDYRPLISSMQQMALPRDNFLAVYPWQIGYLESYYRGAPLNVTEIDSNAWVADPARMAADLDALRAKSARVWIPELQNKGRVVEDAIDSYLRPRDYTAVDAWFGNTRLELFSHLDDPPAAQNRLTLAGLPGLSIRYGIADSAPTRSGDVLPVWLESDGSSNNTFKVSLRLVDRRNNIWAQQDRTMEFGRQRIALQVPAGSPPGAYSITAAFYTDDRTAPLNSQPSEVGHVTLVAPSQPILSAIQTRVQASFRNGIRLLGYSAPTVPIQPGLPSGISLYWQTNQELHSDVQVRIRLDDGHGHVYDVGPFPLARGVYPVERWPLEEMVLDPQSVTLPGTGQDGTYSISIGLVDQGTGKPIPNESGDWAKIGSVIVRARPHYYGAPRPTLRYDANFGGWARLIGYDVVTSDRGAQLVLYWYATSTPQVSYTVFAHITGTDGVIHGQRDQIPGDGKYPTTTWVAGEYLIDTFQIDGLILPGDQLEVGMYELATGDRVPVLDSSSQPHGDHIILPLH